MGLETVFSPSKSLAWSVFGSFILCSKMGLYCVPSDIWWSKEATLVYWPHLATLKRAFQSCCAWGDQGEWIFQNYFLAFPNIEEVEFLSPLHWCSKPAVKKKETAVLRQQGEKKTSQRLKETRTLALPLLSHSWLPQDTWYWINTISRVWPCVLLGPYASTGTGFNPKKVTLCNHKICCIQNVTVLYPF